MSWAAYVLVGLGLAVGLYGLRMAILALYIKSGDWFTTFAYAILAAVSLMASFALIYPNIGGLL